MSKSEPMSFTDDDTVVTAMTEDRLTDVVVNFPVESGEQWRALTEDIPGVSYFATDLDPRSFEFAAGQGRWVGRAELLLKAPAELRPGQARQEVSFTLPVRVVIDEDGEELVITGFDFYSGPPAGAPPPPSSIDPDEGPPKAIGWGPFEGLRHEL